MLRIRSFAVEQVVEQEPLKVMQIHSCPVGQESDQQSHSLNMELVLQQVVVHRE